MKTYRYRKENIFTLHHMNLHSTTLYLKSQRNQINTANAAQYILFCIDVPLDPEMIIAVSFRAFILPFAFSRFRVLLPISCFRAEMPRITGAETHTFPATGFQGVSDPLASKFADPI